MCISGPPKVVGDLSVSNGPGDGGRTCGYQFRSALMPTTRTQSVTTQKIVKADYTRLNGSQPVAPEAD
jgi:hypothetical protein